jgi:hypothetical protein
MFLKVVQKNCTLCLTKHKIPLNNIIGVASDGCNTMVGISFFCISNAEREECAVKSVHACPNLNPYSL